MGNHRNGLFLSPVTPRILRQARLARPDVPEATPVYKYEKKSVIAGIKSAIVDGKASVVASFSWFLGYSPSTVSDRIVIRGMVVVDRLLIGPLGGPEHRGADSEGNQNEIDL